MVCAARLAPDSDGTVLGTSIRLNQHASKQPLDTHERRLLTSIAGGDQDAIVELYNLYFPRLFRFLYRLSHDYGLTEEVANDVMLVVWRSADKFRGASKVSTWIFGIGYRQYMKRLRKRRLPQVGRNEVPEAQFHDCDRVELDDMIAKALAELSPEHRMMIEAVLYLGMTYREVAEIAGCPVNTAKTRVHNARKKLKVALTNLGYVNGAQVD
jgi:RNA polymerase sigma-70 factor (ECF subfamily)